MAQDKLGMQEYPQYSSRERFVIHKNSANSGTTDCKVALFARNQYQQVKYWLECMDSLIDKSQLVIVDNSSEDDGLRYWLRQQEEIGYIICQETLESYAAVLNKVIEEFIVQEDALILSPTYLLLPECMENLQKVLREQKEVVGVCACRAERTRQNSGEAVASEKDGTAAGGQKMLLNLPWEVLMLSNRILCGGGIVLKKNYCSLPPFSWIFPMSI